MICIKFKLYILSFKNGIYVFSVIIIKEEIMHDDIPPINKVNKRFIGSFSTLSCLYKNHIKKILGTKHIVIKAI